MPLPKHEVAVSSWIKIFQISKWEEKEIKSFQRIGQIFITHQKTGERWARDILTF